MKIKSNYKLISDRSLISAMVRLVFKGQQDAVLGLPHRKRFSESIPSYIIINIGRSSSSSRRSHSNTD